VPTAAIGRDVGGAHSSFMPLQLSVRTYLSTDSSVWLQALTGATGRRRAARGARACRPLRKNSDARVRYIACRSCKLNAMTREGITREPPPRPAPWRWNNAFPHIAGVMLAAWLSPAAAQDIRGMEVCTAEAKMERRTGCLQSNVEFLQQALNKLARETQDKVAAAERDLAA